MGPAPAVAAVRAAVRASLALAGSDQPVLVACSGGADSTALAAAVAFQAPRSGRRAGLITVDHGLQDGSAEQARRVANLGYELGLDPVLISVVAVGSTGGPEAAARTARYAALDAARADSQALVMLGHTADDQAETVLLGLGRGSGPRSIAGMRAERDGYLRPLLGLRRSDTRAACAALGLAVFEDPHNTDRRFTRVRLRHEVLPLLDEVLAGGVVQALARTASQLRADLDALDLIAAATLTRASTADGDLSLVELAAEPDAVLNRVLKRWAEMSGSGALSALQVAQLAGLVQHWHGQGPIPLPGGVLATRASGRLSIARCPDRER
jgi:tRNA(Ile)-lysidine synthase